jgi:hypothetical protein
LGQPSLIHHSVLNKEVQMVHSDHGLVLAMPSSPATQSV